MDRAKLDVIRQILLHPFWIILSLVGVFFFFFVLNRGGVIVFLWSGGVFLLVHLVFGDDSIKAIPLYHRLLLGICLSLVLMSLVFSYEQTDTHRLFRIAQMLVIVFCIDFISRTETARHAYSLVGTVLTVSILWQFIARGLFKLPYGTWSNPHYLANFAILTLPLVFYYFMTVSKPYKVLFLLLFVLDIDPVFKMPPVRHSWRFSSVRCLSPLFSPAAATGGSACWRSVSVYFFWASRTTPAFSINSRS